MIEQDGRRFSTSLHAVRQGLVRLPALEGSTTNRANRWIEQVAADAFRAGRTAHRVPRWCVRGVVPSRGHRARLGREGEARFAWDEGETVVLLCRRTHVKDFHSGQRVWLVVTVLAPLDRPPSLAHTSEALRRA